MEAQAIGLRGLSPIVPFFYCYYFLFDSTSLCCCKNAFPVFHCHFVVIFFFSLLIPPYFLFSFFCSYFLLLLVQFSFSSLSSHLTFNVCIVVDILLRSLRMTTCMSQGLNSVSSSTKCNLKLSSFIHETVYISHPSWQRIHSHIGILTKCRWHMQQNFQG